MPTNYFKSFILLIWSVVLTALTIVFGGIPLLGLYRSLGRGPYWLLAIGLTVLFWGLGYPALSIALFSMVLTVGAFAELESLRRPLVTSATHALFIGTGGAALGFALWTKKFGEGWHPHLVTAIQKILDDSFLARVKGGPALEADEILLQMPSAVVIGLVVGLFLALLFERRILNWLQLPTVQREPLSNFRNSDATIWLFIFSLLGAFIQGDIGWAKIVSLNVLNITIVLYFLQGLAVLVKFFEVQRVAAFWRTLMLMVLVIQLFLIVSFVGLVDYWADFRGRMLKKQASPVKKEVK